MKYDVIGLGNPLIDVIVHADDAFLRELGIEKGSMNLVDHDRQNEILEKSHAQHWVTALGGSCANSIVMISQLGGKTAFCGKLGTDDLGHDYQTQLEAMGVASFVKTGEGATGSTIILVTPDADRSMNTHLGMCQQLVSDDVPQQAIEQAKYLYIEGYLWDTPTQKEAVTTAVSLAKKAGVKIALSLSDAFCVERHKAEFKKLALDYVDLLFCNEAEAQHMTDKDKPEDQIEALSQSVPHVVLTLGNKGAMILNGKTVTKVPALDVQAVDTTGAGDSFAAGYLYGVTHGFSALRSGNLAAFLAATIVTQDGPRFDGDLKEKAQTYLVEKN